MKDTELLACDLDEKNDNRVVVRLKTNSWADKRGIHTKKSITFLRRKCKGYNLLYEDTIAIGCDEVMTRIVNLFSMKDGMYEVILFNKQTDWESGYVDSYDYRLVHL